MNYKLFLIIILIPFLSISQKSELLSFNNLVGKTWRAEGEWGDGTKFIQEIRFEYSLDSTLIITNTRGPIDKNSNNLSPRSHGIRQYDKNTNSINFWEFDRSGVVTKGTVFFDGNSIYYQYLYNETILTDMWEYVNNSTYIFKVGKYKEGIWIQTYLNTQFNEIKEP